MTHDDASFSARLTAAIQSKGTPACIGLDPKASALPPALLQNISAPENAAPHQLAEIYLKFCKEVIDVVAPLVPIVKPQLANEAISVQQQKPTRPAGLPDHGPLMR